MSTPRPYHPQPQLRAGSSTAACGSIDDVLGADLVHNILSRLPASSFASGACVSRSWNSICSRILSVPKLSSAISLNPSLEGAVNEVVEKVLWGPIRPHFVIASIGPSFSLVHAHQLITGRFGSSVPVITSLSDGIIGRDALTNEFKEVQWEVLENDEDPNGNKDLLPNQGIMLTVGYLPGLRTTLIPLSSEDEALMIEEFVMDIRKYAFSVPDMSPSAIILFSDLNTDMRPVLQKLDYAFPWETVIVGEGGGRCFFRSDWDKNNSRIQDDNPAVVALVFVKDRNKPPAGLGEIQFHATLSTGLQPVGSAYWAVSVKENKSERTTWLTARNATNQYFDGQSILENIYNEMDSLPDISNEVDIVGDESVKDNTIMDSQTETDGETQAETEADDESHHDQKKKRKRRLTSPVWAHFRLLPRKANEKLQCQCNNCGKKYLAGSENGTGNLTRHLKSCVKMTTKDMGQYMIVSSKDATCLGTRNPQFSQEKFRELLIHAIVRHNMPFSFVQYEAFWNVFKYLEPKVVEISRNTARADIKKLYATQYERLRSELIACPSRISLTSDNWTSIVTDGYMSLTAHFVDDNWKLQKRVLNFSYIPPPHTGQALSEKIYSLVCCWGIEKKLMSITFDNAKSNDACVGILKRQLMLNNALLHRGELFHVRCACHILNLIVKDGLESIDTSVVKIRECVKYVKYSQGRKEKFKQSVVQTSLEFKKSLSQDVPTRWNSTYKMISGALYYRRAFEHFQLLDSCFESCPTPEEWEKVERICGFLEIFHDATDDFSGSLYPTSNLYTPRVFLIELKLREEVLSPDPYIRQIARNMMDKFSKYWSEYNILLAIALVFDPRFKFQFLEFSYGKLYGPDSKELEKVKDTLFDIFDEYMRTSPSNVGSSSSHGNAHTIQSDIQGPSSVLMEFDTFESTVFAAGGRKNQLQMYLDEPRSPRTLSINVLEFWKAEQYRYPDLARFARDVLCVPVSTVASESAFSIGGRTIDQYRSSMTPDMVETLICSRDWLFGEKDLVEMDLEELTRDIITSVNKDQDDCIGDGGSSNLIL